MSTGKRLAKRSIVGSRVAAPIEIDLETSKNNPRLTPPSDASSDAGSNIIIETGSTSDHHKIKRAPKGIFYVPGTISKIQNWIHATYYTVTFNLADVTSNEQQPNFARGGGRYAYLDNLIRTQLPACGTFKADQLVGPGFNSISSIRKLYGGQRVFITYKGREINATVISHDYHADEVTLEIDTVSTVGCVLPMVTSSSIVTLTRKLDEIRLLESRKSTRLQGDATDYTKLASGQVIRLSPAAVDAAAGDNGTGRRRSNSISSSSSTLTFISSSEPPINTQITTAQPQ